MKLDYKKIFLLSLGFFTVSMVWPVYNIAVPLYLKDLALPGFLVGTVMAMDNLFAVIFMPIFGTLSDRTKTPWGRRMPYLLVGVPLAAVFFFLVPFSRGHLVLLMVSVIGLNFFMSVYRAPTVALMPDITPRPLRSRANGIVNFVGGIGTAVSLIGGGILFDRKEFYPFALGTGIMIISIIVMQLFLKEPEQVQEEMLAEAPAQEEPVREMTAAEQEAPAREASQTGTTVTAARKDVLNAYADKGKRLSLIFLLLAIFFWFTGYNAVETFFSTYGQEVLGVGKSMSSYMMATVSVLFLICAIPSGFLSGHLGRKRTILIGLGLFIIVFASLIFVKNTGAIFVLLGLGGIGWALININSYPMVVEMTANKGIGQYTGYYYFFSMMASIVSPILFGFIMDRLSVGFLFIYSTIALVVALFFMLLVRHGEAVGRTGTAFENLEHMDE